MITATKELFQPRQKELKIVITVTEELFVERCNWERVIVVDRKG